MAMEPGQIQPFP